MFVFGLLFLLTSITAYFVTTPQDYENIKELLGEKRVTVDLSYQKFKTTGLLVNSITSVLFLFSGAGILSRKEWARKCTVYFCFLWVAMIFLASLLTPVFIKHLFTQIVYPGIIIIYFTNKKVVDYFLNPARDLSQKHLKDNGLLGNSQ